MEQQAKRILWRGELLEVDFYAFWRVRLILHVTAKGIYIPGFCISTFTHIHLIHNNSILVYIIIITLYHLHTLIDYFYI
jgi:hypothetical protein